MNFKVILHGFFVAVGTAVVGALVPALQSGTMPTGKQIATALLIGLGAGLTYLLKISTIGSSAETPK